MPTAQDAAFDLDINAASDAVGVRPETAVRLMQLAADESAEPAELQHAIEADPNMTVRTLTLANSPFYGVRSRISRIDRAIALLGLNAIAKLAASSSLEKGMGHLRIDAPGLTPDTAWRYSLSVAFATESVVENCPTANAVALRRLGAEAFITGLIADIGFTVQAKLHHDEFTQAVNASLKSGIPLVNHERRLIGIDHAEIGMRLAKHWALPPELVAGIGYHHDPVAADADHRALACVVHVAAQLTRRAGIPALDGDTDMPLLEPAMTHLRLDPRRIDNLIAAVTARLQSVTL